MSDALVVVNASPLIFLGNAGHLELLHTLGTERIIVPEPVFDEVIAGGHTDKAARALSDAIWIDKQPALPIPESVVAWEIGKGESSVIAAALRTTGARVVIDDLNGRKCALAHDLHVIGTLGVVITAHRQGRIDDPQAVLMELRAAGMWLSDAVIARALRVAGIKS